MLAEKFVSVIIATYNMELYLAEAINSVLDQNYDNLEIIIIDDGSTDNTVKVIEKFANEPRVKYFYQINGGQAKAKNRGIVESKGDYIAFLDADDKWTSDKLEKQLPYFDLFTEVGVVYTKVAQIDQFGEILGCPDTRCYSGKITEKLFVENFVTGMASIVRRECFDKVGYFDESLPMGIDWDLWLRISVHFEYYYLDEVTYLYRQWLGQMSKNKRRRYACAVKIMEKFLADNPGLLSSSTINEAWAHTNVGIAISVAKFEGNRLYALKYLGKALRYKFTYLYAWKTFVKILINRYYPGKSIIS